jgi:hypothetical protein
LVVVVAGEVWRNDDPRGTEGGRGTHAGLFRHQTHRNTT